MKHFLCVILGSGSYEYCAESFLFSLVNPSGNEPTKMPLKGTVNQNWIYCNSGYGPSFGAGHDLYIANGGNASSSSYSNLGHTYQCPAKAILTVCILSTYGECISYYIRATQCVTVRTFPTDCNSPYA